MNRAHRYVIFRINDEKNRIVVDKVGGRDEDFEKFKESLDKDKCRYACYEFEYKTNDNRTESKIFFFLYAPDCCTANEKFIYATTKATIQKKV
mmetsp:Transcript_40748/g.30002  ORF Transcript_40748/g.30002 Transcript_40748/m.30002 type:complete len:93 (+) Transcript_40748:105-383(+)